jgi:hypothetical protein
MEAQKLKTCRGFAREPDCDKNAPLFKELGLAEREGFEASVRLLLDDPAKCLRSSTAQRMSSHSPRCEPAGDQLGFA